MHCSSYDITPVFAGVNGRWDHHASIKLIFYFVVEKRIDFGELRIIPVRQCNTLHARLALISPFTSSHPSPRFYMTRTWTVSLQGPGGYEQQCSLALMKVLPKNN